MSLVSENVGYSAGVEEHQRAQAATSEILRVISLAATNPQPVFDLIAKSATTLCGAEVCTVTRFDGNGCISMQSLAPTQQELIPCAALSLCDRAVREGRRVPFVNAPSSRSLMFVRINSIKFRRQPLRRGFAR